MRKAKSLWFYLGSRLVGFALVVVLLAASMQLYLAYVLKQQDDLERLVSANVSYAERVDQFLVAMMLQVESIAENSIVINSLIDVSGRDSYLPLYLDTIGIFGRTDVAVRLVDFQNTLIAANFLGAQLVQFPPQRQWLNQVLTEARPWVHPTGEGIYIAHPILNRDYAEGAILLFVHREMLADGLASIESRYDQQITTRAGRVLFSSVTDPISFDKTPADITFSPLVSLADFDLDTRLFQPTPGFTLRENNFVFFVIVTLLIMIISYWLVLAVTVKRVNEVFMSLKKAIDKVSHSQDLTARVVTEGSPEELVTIGIQFNDMLAKLQDSTTSHDEIESIMQSMGESVFVCDAEMMVYISNHENLYDRELQHISEFIAAPTDHAIFDRHMEVSQFEQSLEGVTVLWRRLPLIVKNEKRGWVFTGSDISEIRNAEQQMRLLNMAFDSSSNGMIVVEADDPKEPIVFANQSVTKITGYDNLQIVGRKCNFLQGEGTDRNTVRTLSVAIQNKQPVSVEILNYRQNGEPFWNQLSIDPVFNDKGKATHFLGVLRDITALIEAREELQLAKESAEAAAVAKSDFLATMSHEIRTPMNGVLSMLDLLLNTQLNEEQMHRATIAQSSARSLLILINDILDFSKIEAGKFDLEVISFDLPKMLGEFAETIAIQAQMKGLELVLDLIGVEVREVTGDANRLRQILINLVGNAIKFTDSGEILIHVSLHAEEDHWRLVGTIKDTGLGIEKAQIPRLFEAFSQGDASTTRKFGGTGLGLAIVKRLCELQGGQIAVTSELGQGSEFTFTLRLEKAAEASLITPPNVIRHCDVLILDHHSTAASVVAQQLKQWGGKAQGVTSVEQALTVLRERAAISATVLPNILIVDFQIPEKQRATLLAYVSGLNSQEPLYLVGVSEMSYLPQIDDPVRQDFDLILPKPLTTADLFKIISLLDSVAPSMAMPSALPPEAQSAHDMEQLWPTNARVLVVDDNKINQTVALTMLEYLGLTAELAGDGHAAIQKLQMAEPERPFTLVFMDCQMPVIDGYDASQRIRSGAAGDRYRDVPIIAMTANAMQGDRERCLAAGMVDYIAKPIESPAIKEKLFKWLLPNTKHGLSAFERLAGQAPLSSAEATGEQGLQIWNHSNLRQRLNGNDQMIDALVRLYLDDNDQRIDEIHAAKAEADYDLIHRHAHTIKGITATLGAEQTQQAAATVENAIKQNQLSRLPQQLTELFTAETRMKKCFQEHIAKVEQVSAVDAEAEPLSRRQLGALLKSLHLSLERHEFIDMDAITDLRRPQADGQLQKTLLQLHRHIERFDVAKALALIELTAKRHQLPVFEPTN